MKEKKSKKGLFIFIGIVLVLFLVVCYLVGSGEEASDGMSTSESYDNFASGDDEYSNQEYDNEGKVGNMNVDARDLSSEEEFPMGTCSELEGKIVIMSIAADTATTTWNFDDPADMDTIGYISREVGIGLNWIEEQAKNYGKDVEFIYNWDDDAELFYTAQLQEDYSASDSNLQDQKLFIDEKLSSYANKLIDKYNADGILFMYYINLPQSNTQFQCFATPFQGTELGMDLPYETVVLSKYVFKQEQGPATYAHEILHCFGAPDLYSVDMDGTNYGMTQEFVDYCDANHKNEIMVSCYDPFTNTIPLDNVTNDLTDITAYYLGWIDSCEECEQFGVANSAH